MNLLFVVAMRTDLKTEPFRSVLPWRLPGTGSHGVLGLLGLCYR